MSTFALTPDQEMLQRTVRDVLRERSPVSAARKLRDDNHPDGFDRRLWRELAELGVVGVALPEAHGGSDLGFRELGIVSEELGRNLCATPFFASSVLGAELLRLAGNEAQRAILPKVSAGEVLLAVAYNEGPHHAPERCSTRAEATADGFVLRGRKRFVLDGHVAQQLYVLARTAGGDRESAGLTLFEVDARASGVRIERVNMVDGRNAAHITLEGVKVASKAIVGERDQGLVALERVLARAAIALSAEMLGGARAAFEMTIDYLKTRKQFGVLIGTFQALKHRAADLYAELELSRSVVIDALRAVDEQRADVPAMAAIAKARLSDVFVRVAAEGVQMHGGIGVTDEHDIGLFYKRARTAELLLGDGNYQRARFAALRGY
jgi:alkylation response protein AidB-like acyl-CoA dehydrogenase